MWWDPGNCTGTGTAVGSRRSSYLLIKFKTFSLKTPGLQIGTVQGFAKFVIWYCERPTALKEPDFNAGFGDRIAVTW